MIIPKAGQLEVLQELHEAHPGTTCMKQLARVLVCDSLTSVQMIWRRLKSTDSYAYIIVMHLVLVK